MLGMCRGIPQTSVTCQRLVEEDEVLERIRGMVGNGIEAFGLRDDAAVLDLPGAGPLLASVDSVVEGVHVDLALCSPGDVGWKALMGALSDLAAMGAAPLAALVALCVPGGTGEGELALGGHGRRGRGLGGDRVPGGRRRRLGRVRAGGGRDGAGHGRGRWSAARPACRGAAGGRRAGHGPVRGFGGGPAASSVPAARTAPPWPPTGARWPACGRANWPGGRVRTP